MQLDLWAVFQVKLTQINRLQQELKMKISNENTIVIQEKSSAQTILSLASK